MSGIPASVSSLLAPAAHSYLPLVVACLVAGVLAALARRWPWAGGIGAAAGALAGWSLLGAGGWRGMFLPRTTVECLAVPALAIVCAGLVGVRFRGRWVGAAAVCFCAWWLAWSPAGRLEFWRVGFAAVVVAYVLRRVGAGGAKAAVVVAFTTLGGAVLGGVAAVWIVAAGVLAAACVAVWALGRGALVPAGLLMVGLMGTDLGGGRLLRGGLGVLDLVCGGAMIAPLLLNRAERGVRGRLGRASGVAGVLIVAVGIDCVAWVLTRRCMVAVNFLFRSSR